MENTQNERLQKIKKFLSFFGKPFCTILETKEYPPLKKVRTTVYRTLEQLVVLNEQSTYGIHFTPNGNTGRLIKPGDIINGIRTDKNASLPINCLFVEIDLKFIENETKEGLHEKIHKTIYKYGCPPSIIVETPNGYHLYWLLDDQAKEIATFENAKNITSFLVDIFEADKNNAYSPIKLMRIPFSYHRKTKEPILVKYTQLSNGKRINDIDPDNIFKLSLSNYQSAIQYAENKIKDQKKVDKAVERFDQSIIAKIDEISMLDLVNNKLDGKILIHNNKEYTFKINDNGDIYVNGKPTDGYKYNFRKNYINCFTKEYHPIEERPRGGVVSFLYYFFKKDLIKVNNFLKEHYGISVFDNDKLKEADHITSIVMRDYAINFFTDRVSIEKIVTTRSGSVSEQDVLFRKSVDIIGRVILKDTGGFTTGEEEYKAYLVKVDNKQIVLHRETRVSSFNTKNDGVCFFYGSDRDLGMFFEALDQHKFKEFRVVEKNGYWLDNLYLGGKPVFEEKNPELIHNTINFKFDTTINTNKELSVKDFYYKMSKVFSDEISLIALLGGIACAGLNIRGEKEVYPGVLITGLTGSGKSTIQTAIKYFLGYKGKAREYGYRGLTPQPLKQYATDNSILFLDEVTGKVAPGLEEVLRLIINRTSGSRGSINSNIFYDFCSPIYGTGERMFSEESLNNRFIIIPLSHKDKKTTATIEDITDINNYIGIKEIGQTFLNNRDKIDKLYSNYKNLLLKEGINSRSCDIRSYIFVVNHIFGYLIDNQNLYLIAKKLLNRIGMGPKLDITYDKQLFFFLCSSFASKIPRIIAFYDEENGIYDFQFVDDNYRETNRAKIYSIMEGLMSDGVVIRETEKGFSIRLNIEAILTQSTSQVSKTEYNLYHFIQNAKSVGKAYITVNR